MTALVPRPYQAEGIRQIREAYRNKRVAPLYVAATGAGKTVTFCIIARSAIASGKRVCIVVHREELLAQSSRSLEALGIPHGIIASGVTPDPTQLVQIAMVGTLRRRLESQQWIWPFDLIIFDEGHHAVAGEWSSIRQLQPAARLLGVTATPQRLDGKGLGVSVGGVYDEMILGPSCAELMEDGYLTRAAIFCPPNKLELAKVRMRGGDYATSALAQVMDRPTITGDAVAHYTQLCARQPAIAFCASVEHAQHVAEQFRAAGYAADSIDGKLSSAERRRRIEGLGNGSLHVLTSCEIISEGTDIPIVTAAILLRPTESEALHLQQCGRVLRPVYAPGYDLSTREGRMAAIRNGPKPRAVIIDHVGNCANPALGPPDAPREWSLAGRLKATRSKSTTDNSPSLRVALCPECFRQHSAAPKCPECGHVYVADVAAPKQVAGTLREMNEEDRAAVLGAIDAEKQAKRDEVNNAKTIEELLQIAKARGYQASWAWMTWRRQSWRRAPAAQPPPPRSNE